MRIRNFPNAVAGMLLWLWFMSIAAAGVTQETQEISVDNTATSIGESRWSWKVFLKASPQVLQNIECVEYTLHPTFPRPFQRVCTIGDENYPFALSATGWGTFQIQIRVFMKDGQKKDLTYNLRF
jgi:transcription initiation factor IIF auxiliary subunit